MSALCHVAMSSFWVEVETDSDLLYIVIKRCAKDVGTVNGA